MSKSHQGIKKSESHKQNMRKPKSESHKEGIKIHKVNKSINEKGLYQLNNSSKLLTFGELKNISKNLYLTNEENYLGKSNKSSSTLKRFGKEDLIGLYVINMYKRVEI